MKSLFLCLALLPFASFATPPGRTLYLQHCARCHGKDGSLGLNGAHDLTFSNLNTTGRTYMVSKGLGKMPAFEKQLTATQIQEIVAYTLTLK